MGCWMSQAGQGKMSDSETDFRLRIEDGRCYEDVANSVSLLKNSALK